MTVNKYKIGEFVIKILTPVPVENEPPYDAFLCGDEKENYTVDFQFASSFPEHIDAPDYSTDVTACKFINGKMHAYYGGNYGGKIYAERISDKNGCTVKISDSYRKNFFTKVVFSHIGIEEIAAMNNAVIFHSSFINVNGTAILFTGHCGIGKSTQADLWKKYRNAEIINGDKSLIYLKNGVPMVSGLPFSGSSEYCENKQFPIKAIVDLSQAKYNNIQEINGIRAFSAIFRSSYPASNIRELKDRQADVIEKIASGVKVIHLSCLPDESAVKCLEDELC